MMKKKNKNNKNNKNKKKQKKKKNKKKENKKQKKKKKKLLFLPSKGCVQICEAHNKNKYLQLSSENILAKKS